MPRKFLNIFHIETLNIFYSTVPASRIAHNSKFIKYSSCYQILYAENNEKFANIVPASRNF